MKLRQILIAVIISVVFLYGSVSFAEKNDKSAKSKKSTEEKKNIDTNVPTVITCDGPLDADFEKNIAIFHENVVVKDQKGELFSDILKVFFKQGKNRQVDLIEAEGNVIIHMESKVAKSDKAVYKVDEGLLELTGNPRITENKNIYSADTIKIYRKNGKTEIKLEPKAKLILYREEKANEGLLF